MGIRNFFRHFSPMFFLFAHNPSWGFVTEVNHIPEFAAHLS